MRKLNTKKLLKKSIISRLQFKQFKGFTVIELLVVVGIMGLLTGVTVSTMNIKQNYENAQDSVRKSDLNTLHKAFVQYYIDNRCIYPKSDWDTLTCNGTPPPELQPYLSTIPCDPETGEKYGYEPLDNNCRVCNSGCGVCVGLRLMTHIKHQKNHKGGQNAGCDEQRGCGVTAPDGTAYNYGVSLMNSCIIPTPIISPTQPILPSQTPIPTITPTSTIAPTATQTPTPVSSPTPTPSPAQIVNTNVGQECIGNLLPNGSFEVDANADRWPDGWGQWGTPEIDEGVVCTGGTIGNCRFVQHYYISHQLRISFGYIDTIVRPESISGPAGTTFTYSYDVKTSPGTGGNARMGFQLILSNADGTTQQTSLYVDTDKPDMATADTWYHGEKTIVAQKPFVNIYMSGFGHSPYERYFSSDNLCLIKVQ